MNSFTNAILTLMLGWLRTLLNAARDFVSSDSSTAFFDFFRNNWRIIFLALCIIGFALDMIVYLLRWRPHSFWLRRRARRLRQSRPPQEADYDLSEFDADTSVIATDDYAPVPEYPYADVGAAPTVQYQIQSHQNEQYLDSPPVYLPYTTPYFAPEASQNVMDENDAPPLYRDEPQQSLPFASVPDRLQQFAFGMAPSFGSAQSEPAYNYHRDAASFFAPPQISQDYLPEESFAPQLTPEQMTGDMEAVPLPAYQQPNPYFRPFSDRGGETFSPPKARGLGAVAKKARDILSPDESYDALTYKDFHPTVDVSKAFHSPVYPEKKSEGDS